MKKRIKKKKEKEIEYASRYGDAYNEEGYGDPTFLAALKNIQKAEKNERRKKGRVL